MVKKSHLKPPSRGLARTVYTAENFKLHILFLQGCKNSKAFGSNWQIVFRLVPKQRNQMLKITGKMLRISQIHGRLAKLGLQMNSSQQQFLNKRKKASVKNSNTEAGPVP